MSGRSTYSYSQPRDPPEDLSKYFSDAISDPNKLPELVAKILEIQRDDALKIIGKTSKTGYRRVHEHIASAIDRALDICLTTKKLNDNDINEMSLLLTRGLILIGYQEARDKDQLSVALGNSIRSIIKYLLNQLKTERDAEKIKHSLEVARTLIDSLTVMVYRFVSR